jgi:hypothetical protein
MAHRTPLDLDRRDRNFTISKVKEVLPEHYVSEYPNLVKFLDYYYDWMDSDATHGFDNTLHNLYSIRDLQATDLTLLNQIFQEIGQGLVSASYFTDPRQAAGLLANFYKIKGSIYSAEGFFRAFYGEQPEVVYPKNNLFIIGESQIGAESLKYIQNGALYQVLSVLIRSGIPITKWRDIYKAFVHPAGFHLAGEVIIESLGDLNISQMPLSIPDSDAGVFTYDFFASTTTSSVFSITGVIPDDGDADSARERISLNTIISTYSEITVEQLNAVYNSIEDVISANKHTFDADSDGTIKSIRFSSGLETMDGVKFDNFNPLRYVEVDSA